MKQTETDTVLEGRKSKTEAALAKFDDITETLKPVYDFKTN